MAITAAGAAAETLTPQQMGDRAIGFLETKGQADDGSFSAASSPAITALVTAGNLRNGRSPQAPVVAKALKYLEKFVRDDGGIYAEGTVNKNYETCIAMICFHEANRGGKYDMLLKKAEAYVKTNQWGATHEREAEPSDV